MFTLFSGKFNERGIRIVNILMFMLKYVFELDSGGSIHFSARENDKRFLFRKKCNCLTLRNNGQRL